ncbi:MAG: hypothetical protein DRO46_01565 [Candidatus Hecatellales archaeon]|nr:MAG: hypothetical protein DRO46_01565 [Candidatus Hecatellales archaeon]
MGEEKAEKRPYYFVLDLYPQEHKEETRIWEFYENLKKGRFTTLKCKKCGHILWPPEVICPECTSDELEWIDMPPRGKIYAFTVQVGAVPLGFKPPLIQAIVDFPNGVRVIGPIADASPEEVKVGDEVEVKVIEIPPDAHGDRVLFCFKKVK